MTQYAFDTSSASERPEWLPEAFAVKEYGVVAVVAAPPRGKYGLLGLVVMRFRNPALLFTYVGLHDQQLPVIQQLCQYAQQLDELLQAGWRMTSATTLSRPNNKTECVFRPQALDSNSGGYQRSQSALIDLQATFEQLPQLKGFSQQLDQWRQQLDQLPSTTAISTIQELVAAYPALDEEQAQTIWQQATVNGKTDQHALHQAAQQATLPNLQQTLLSPRPSAKETT